MSDPRTKRTRDKLGDALLALLRERPFAAITVQDVLDRAGVGRSTFYAHFKDKQDLFVSDYEQFLEAFAAAAPGDGRVFCVRELFAHVQDNRDLLSVFAEAGLLADFLELAEACFARAIEARLPPGVAHRAMRGRALAAVLLSMLRQWTGTPDELDDFFHSLV